MKVLFVRLKKILGSYKLAKGRSEPGNSSRYSKCMCIRFEIYHDLFNAGIHCIITCTHLHNNQVVRVYFPIYTVLILDLQLKTSRVERLPARPQQQDIGNSIMCNIFKEVILVWLFISRISKLIRMITMYHVGVFGGEQMDQLGFMEKCI